MEWIILQRTDIHEQQIYWDYDEDGNPIPNTDRVFDYNMVNTLVEYFFPEYNTKITVEVHHFNPQSEEEIELGIDNRGITEERKLENE
jgi:hypothetical protein